IYEYAREVHDCLVKGKVGSTDRLLYNAEILSKVFMGCRVDQDPMPLVEEVTPVDVNQPRCASCNIVKTPEWRKGPLVWGKMSRSKAALAKNAAKKQSEAAAKDSGSSGGGRGSTPASNANKTGGQKTAMEDSPKSDPSLIQPSTEKRPMDDMRKRGREDSPVEDDNSLEGSKADDSMDGLDEAESIKVAQLSLTSSQAPGQPDNGSFLAQEQLLPAEQQVESQAQSQPQPLPEVEMTKVDDSATGEPLSTATGKKLALSFLLD
ncbi:hypothetical protein BGZ94_001790, partial [Podila epigama]